MSELLDFRALKDKDNLVDQIILVKQKNLSIGKNGKPFLHLLLGNKTGHMDARMWDQVEETAKLFEVGDLVKIKGAVQVYNNRKQLVIHKLVLADDPSLNVKDFLMESKTIDVSSLFIQLTQFVEQIKNSYIKQLCMDCLQDETIKEKLLQSPAAKTMHHAHRGGLLAHIVSICHLMQFMASHYQYLNKDFLFFGALFHDLGKIDELEISDQNIISYSEKGQLLGHMQIVCELIDKKSNRIFGFPEDLKMLLKHIVLSHHGKIEYGSAKLPMFAEAFLVAQIDDLDAKMDQIHTFVESEKMTGDAWSRYHEKFERYFYIADLKTKWSDHD